jgi:hypothetical protein
MAATGGKNTLRMAIHNTDIFGSRRIRASQFSALVLSASKFVSFQSHSPIECVIQRSKFSKA